MKALLNLIFLTSYLSHACEEFARIRHILACMIYMYDQLKILIGTNSSQYLFFRPVENSKVFVTPAKNSCEFFKGVNK